MGEKGYLNLLKKKKPYQVLVETDRTVGTSLLHAQYMLSKNVIARLFHAMNMMFNILIKLGKFLTCINAAHV